MAPTRYEVRVNGSLSERARGAFCALDVTSVPAQTVVFGSLPRPADLSDLLALCSTMGLEVVSVRRLPAELETAPGTDAVADAEMGTEGRP